MQEVIESLRAHAVIFCDDGHGQSLFALENQIAVVGFGLELCLFFRQRRDLLVLCFQLVGNAPQKVRVNRRVRINVQAGLANRRDNFRREPFTKFLRVGFAAVEDYVIQAVLVDEIHFLSSAKIVNDGVPAKHLIFETLNNLCHLRQFENFANIGKAEARIFRIADSSHVAKVGMIENG